MSRYKLTDRPNHSKFYQQQMELEDTSNKWLTSVQWWGYKHINGSFQAKRFFDPEDISEARSSDFVESVFGPFLANNREHALEIISETLG